MTKRILLAIALLVPCVVYAFWSPAADTPEASLFDGETGGCGSCFVYRLSKSKTFAITVDVDEEALGTADAQVTIPIKPADSKAAVHVHEYRSLAKVTYCDCVAGDSPINDWTAVSGEILLVRSHDPPPAKAPAATHRVSLTLKNLRLKNERTGQLISLGEVHIRDVWVGWLVG